jgi:phage repressor protein C with HTH and peptisase S24 domain
MSIIYFHFLGIFIYNFKILLYYEFTERGDTMNEYLITQLKQGRLNKGFKQSDVTKAIGIKNTTLSNYENGITEPDIDTFLSLCELYELDFVSIMEEAYGIKIVGKDFHIKPSEIESVKKYRILDEHGKKIVDFVLDEEYNRSISTPAPAANRVINYYYRMASAGTGQIIFDTPPTKEIEIPNIPKYAKVSYAIGVNGNSMEPAYHDGDMLLIEMTDKIEVGEIGIFRIDNESYVKKLGYKKLISLNPECADIPLNETLGCMGRVIDKL